MSLLQPLLRQVSTERVQYAHLLVIRGIVRHLTGTTTHAWCLILNNRTFAWSMGYIDRPDKKRDARSSDQ